jgi:two-component system CheB/CheR fusion protein
MPSPRFEGVTVLVVEDHADSRHALRQMLEAVGIDVVEAADAALALRLLRERHADLVFCDLMLPGLDGFTFMERVRTDPKLRHLRVVAITGLTSHQDLMRAWKAGFDGYLTKPIDYGTVVATLRRVFWAKPDG